MKIFVGQIYISAGIEFPFSLRFQKWLGDTLSERIEVSGEFSKKFGVDFKLGFRLSAKEEIGEPEIRGPTVFKRDKDVEFSIFLPFRSKDYHDPVEASLILEQFLRAAAQVMNQIGLNTDKLLTDLPHIKTEFLRTPGLLRDRDS